MSRGDHLAAAGRLVKVPAFVLMCFADGIEIGLFKCLWPDYSMSKAGDMAILPAGTGHQCLSSDDAFLVVGAYPPTGTYDEPQDHSETPLPRKDPVYGTGGPLSKLWKRAT